MPLENKFKLMSGLLLLNFKPIQNSSLPGLMSINSTNNKKFLLLTNNLTWLLVIIIIIICNYAYTQTKNVIRLNIKYTILELHTP